VKEGVGAGAAAIAAYLYQKWDNETLVKQIENLLDTSHNINF
jgi:NaMN:DMB phosphoribosyltransferase